MENLKFINFLLVIIAVLKSFKIEKVSLMLLIISSLIFLIVLVSENFNFSSNSKNDSVFDTIKVYNKVDEVLKNNGAESIKRKNIIIKQKNVGRTESNIIFSKAFDQIQIIQLLQNELSEENIKVQGATTTVKGKNQIHLSFNKKIFETLNLQIKKEKKNKK